MADGSEHKSESQPDTSAPTAFDSVPASATGVLHIDLGALQRNYRMLAALAAPTKCAAVVKADAYGLGAAEVVPALVAAGCRTFFVATLAEAKMLTQTAAGASVYVLDGLFPGAAPEFLAAGVRPVLGSMDELREWVTAASGHPAALHLDTGMNRLGIKPAAYPDLIAANDVLKSVPIDLLMSHLACADTPENAKNAAQLAAFVDVTAKLPATRRSLANSAGIFLGPKYTFDLARPGIALFGGNPFAARPNPMEPVIRLYARIAQLGEAERGETVGYGAARRLTRHTRYATVTAGYADGYFRSLGSTDGHEGALAWLGEYAVPILGRVSMDLIVLDVTNLPDGLAQRGGLVELIGERFTVDDAARIAGTIPYEVLTSLGKRYRRIYTGLESLQEASAES